MNDLGNNGLLKDSFFAVIFKQVNSRWLTLRGVELVELKIRIFQQNHFSLLITGPGGFDS